MPRTVALAPWTSHWTIRAGALIADLHAAAPGAFVAVHHVGSTAVPGQMAKPVIDLLGETGDLALIEAARPALEGLGWRWRGENGVAGRRYFTRDDPETGARDVHLHVYAAGDPALAWHLAFRDRLRPTPPRPPPMKARSCAARPCIRTTAGPMRRARRRGRTGWRRRRCGGGPNADPPTLFLLVWPLGQSRSGSGLGIFSGPPVL